MIRSMLFSLLFAAACASSPPPVTPSADLALVGGRVFTGEAGMPWAEAIAVVGERIAAVGSDEAIRARIGASTRVIPLEGRLVVPGINDAHVHEPWEQPTGVAIEIPAGASVESVLDLVRNAASAAPEDSWIRGQLPPPLFDAPLGRVQLDAAAPHHPVRLVLGAHASLLNSAALRKWGIGEEDSDPPGGRYGRTAGGALNGWVFEYPLWAAARRSAATIPDAALLERIREFEERALRWGITSVQTLPVVPAERMERLLEHLGPAIRWRVMDFRMPPFEPVAGVRAVKTILDGTPVERGSALSRPYADAAEERGFLNFTQDEIDAMVREAGRGESQLLLHVSGDAAAAALLEAMGRAGGVDWPRRRLRIEHGDGLTTQQLETAARLGVVVVQNPSHFTRPALVAARFGPRREFGRFRSILEKEIPLALGSDGPLNPWLNLMFAATHPANPAEAISLEDALRAYTRGSAFAEFEEHRKGTIAPGMLADFAVLSQDVFAIPLEVLPRTTSVLTVVGGKVVWQDEALGTAP